MDYVDQAPKSRNDSWDSLRKDWWKEPHTLPAQTQRRSAAVSLEEPLDFGHYRTGLRLIHHHRNRYTGIRRDRKLSILRCGWGMVGPQLKESLQFPHPQSLDWNWS